ncbi:hypothetical protein ACQY0O_002801 [Thecaphora frezii]
MDPGRSIAVKGLDTEFVRGGTPRVEIRGVDIVPEVPLPITYDIRAITAELDVMFADRGLLARVSFDETDVQGTAQVTDEATKTATNEGDGNANRKRLELQPPKFELMSDDEALLAEAVAHICRYKTTDQIRIAGAARAKVATALGELWLPVDLDRREHALSIQGLRSLRSSPVQYTNLQVVEASPEYLKIVFSLYLNNPSRTLQVRIRDSDFSMAAYYRSVYVGRAYIRGGFVMPPSPVAIQDIHFRYCPTPAPSGRGKTSTLEICGDAESIDDALLVPALQQIWLSFDLKPMIDQTLFESISITLGVGVVTGNVVECQFVVNNPLGVPFDLSAVSTLLPMRVPPGTPQQPGKQQSSTVNVPLSQPLEKLVTAFLQEKGASHLDVELSARVEVQGFRISVFHYRQPRLPLHIKGLGGVAGLLKFGPGEALRSVVPLRLRFEAVSPRLPV